MKWNEFLQGLDSIRADIRSRQNLKEEITHPNPVFDTLFNLMTDQPIFKVEEPAPLPVDDGLLSCAPEAPLVIDRGDGEGRMVVMPRETKRVSRPPMLEEVFDEKELGK